MYDICSQVLVKRFDEMLESEHQDRRQQRLDAQLRHLDAQLEWPPLCSAAMFRLIPMQFRASLSERRRPPLFPRVCSHVQKGPFALYLIQFSVQYRLVHHVTVRIQVGAQDFMEDVSLFVLSGLALLTQPCAHHHTHVAPAR